MDTLDSFKSNYFKKIKKKKNTIFYKVVIYLKNKM